MQSLPMEILPPEQTLDTALLSESIIFCSKAAATMLGRRKDVDFCPPSCLMFRFQLCIPTYPFHTRLL